jgi:glycine cleavage system aminomethyltransferase T
VARIHYRGHVNRHLRGLRSADPIPGGGRLFDGPKDVGLVTSATRSDRLGHVALGYVRREVEPGSTLAMSPDGERTVDVVLLPFTTT